MFVLIRKISLRARLFALTAFALIALLVAVLSAYRTARTSAIYSERQAAASVNLAVRELTRARDGGGEAENYSKNRRLPPHIEEAYQKYQDLWTRRTAIALHGEREVSGGFCTATGETKGALFNQNFSTDEQQFVQNACRQTNENNSRRYDFGNSTLFIVSAQIDGESNEISGAFAVRRVEKSSIFADRFNLLTQIFLLFSAVGLVIFSMLTLRDWRAGMRQIEKGLQAIPLDLSTRIADAPPIGELAQISREINRLAANLETNLQKQKSLEKDLAHSEKLAALGRMASGAAHEIRNPLAAMKLKIQLAERNKFDAQKLEKTFAVLSEEIERLDKIVKKMLDASRPAKLNASLINLHDLIAERLTMIAEKAEQQAVKIEFETETTFEKIEADGEKLTQVFDNLFNNALEAMSVGGGVLRVKIRTKNERFFAEIADTGEGIDAADRARLFELFYTTKEKGTGLGLAISREIAEAHGGKLELAESKTGAVFIVELPRHQV